MTNTIKLLTIIIFALTLIGCEEPAPATNDYYTACVKFGTQSSCQEYLNRTVYEDDALNQMPSDQILATTSARKAVMSKLVGITKTQQEAIKQYASTLPENQNSNTNTKTEIVKR
jgi:PBP1b-binding outer membrane lipoprotein LpoB